MGVFHHLKAGLLREAEDVEEFPSEYSDDYNVSSGSQASRNVKILGKGSRRAVSCQQLPSSPVLMSQVSAKRKVFIEDEEEGILLGRGDSGFNSERESSGVSVGVYSDCLDHYGLDGPSSPPWRMSPVIRSPSQEVTRTTSPPRWTSGRRRPV